MDKGATCEHLNKLADVLGKDTNQPKENVSCFDCGCPGPNLWMCLQPDCRHIGCSEVKNDHSTIHQKTYPLHCVHMNISTERIWCYICEKEVHMAAALARTTMSPDTTSLDSGFGSRVGTGLNQSPDDEDLEYSDERPKGLVGLQNMGNTCYMNAALQALSNTAPLTSYFLECAAIVNILAGDKKPGLSRAYQKLIKDMWSRRTRGYVVPNGILYGIRNVHPMFRGYHQHDTQEFLRCFMDQLHEELKEPVTLDVDYQLRTTPLNKTFTRLDYGATCVDKMETRLEHRILSGHYKAPGQIWDNSEDNLTLEADGDHDHQDKPAYIRRRAASSGANDASYFSRLRRKSPCYSESRAEGYLRVQQSEPGPSGRGHRRSASFAGTHHTSCSYNVLSRQTNGPDSTQDDNCSESDPSCSSENEERYETCSSGDNETPDTRPDNVMRHKKNSIPCGGGDGTSGSMRYRSVISDVFDGKLLSSVQCLICDRVSTRVETFQDLSLPIPSREHLAVLRCQQPVMSHHGPPHGSQESWMWWVLSWLRSWFYGPVVSLQDCLAAFFSADELKGDNMYSCSRCNKLRNGVKMSGVVRLPEVLCVHLKRFRHELMFSAKVAARVSFPLHDLNMAPYTHKDCTSKITRYDLFAVICHAGTAGGGHYTCVAKNSRNWYMFDDQCVTPMSPNQLANCEAYVLFYRKVNPQMSVLRQKAAEILENTAVDPNDIKFYISKQWINKFNTWAEPGPIDNSDFVCGHGGVRPERSQDLHEIAVVVTQSLWEFLYSHFGGGPAMTHAHQCAVCARAAHRLRTRRAAERAAFEDLHAMFQNQERPRAIYAISMNWFRQWQAFVRGQQQPPPPVDNSGILTKQDIDGVATYVLKQGSDHAQLSEELWKFFTEIYGGGPEIRLKSPTSIAQPTLNEREVIINVQQNDANRLTRKYSESDKEDYCSNSKSTSETNLKDPIFQGELQKNQSLQNINRNYKVSQSADSEEEYRNSFHYKREPNGNCQDSDEEMELDHGYVNKVTTWGENGVDSSDHDTNDNPVYYLQKTSADRLKESELPNLDSISLKSKRKEHRGKKFKRRTVK